MNRFFHAVDRPSSMACLAALALAACSSGGTSAPRPIVSSFQATPSSIVAGQATTLEWSVSGATSLSIDHGVGAVTGSSVTVSPTVTTVYALTATNDVGSVTIVTSVIVAPAPPRPVIASFVASPTHVAPGGTASLSWSASGATSFSIDNGVGTVTGTSVAVTPAATTTYTLTATNANGSVTATATVTVTTDPLPVFTSFTASPSHVAPGQPSTLAWVVSGATSMTIDNGVGVVTGTSVVVTPAATTVYTMTATNAAGSVSHSVTVAVSTAPLPAFTSFTATPSTIVRGASSTLAWVVGGATTLSIDQGVGTVTGTSVAVSPMATTTYTMTATNAAGSVTHSATVTIPAASLLFTSATGGAGMLGEITEFPLALTGTASTVHGFAGRPYIGALEPALDGQGLVWNDADDKFYGVLNGGGAWETGVLVSFDPVTDALVLLKTLSGRTYPAQAGLAGDKFAFEKLTGFYRRPLLTPDGKGLLLLSTDGGVILEGALVYVNIDPASANYLADTMVYSFFDYEVGQGSYCKSIRVSNRSGQSEMVWGKDGSGNDAVFMARNGENYEVLPTNPPNEPGNCNPWVFDGKPHDKIYGRMFALRPTDAADLSKPWTYALGYENPVKPGQGFVDPLLFMGRQIYWDSYGVGLYPSGVRWTTSGPGSGGQMYFYRAGTELGSSLFWEVQHRAYRPGGLLPLDTFGNSIALYSGLHGSTDPLVPDSPPRIFTFTRSGTLDQQAALGGWYTDFKGFRGANMSLLSRRLFANGGDESDCLFGALDPCVPSTIEEMDPAIGYPQRILVGASEATTGQYFFGDPGVGGSVREPIADRWVVWFGTQRLGYSTTLNKYDRVTGTTTTLTFDPTDGAYPKGKLLDLGNGTALGFADRTRPTAAQGKYGYVAGPGADGSVPGFYVLDLASGATLSWIRYSASVGFLDFSPEAVRLDDGSVWTAVDYRDHLSGDFRVLSRLNMTTGVFTTLFEKLEAWNYSPADAYVPAGRRSAALYMPFWQGSVTPFSDHLVNATLGCVRADAGTVNAQSLVFGPASAASGNANRIVYGATYSPANDAMYLATAKVANADQGTIFEIDKGVADASLCRATPVVTALVTGLADVPSTKPLATRAGALLYGTANGKLMRIDVAGRAVVPVADLKAAGVAVSQVKGYLAESVDGMVVAVVFDYDGSGKNTARRLVSVAVGTGAWTSRDVTTLVEEWEPYPGVMKRN
ncbi:MAG: hypothetical protein WB493_17440 [Anaeromyxobacteraceae bacterium]